MKVTLYMAISANGMIARDDDSTDWTSPEDWEGFKKMAAKVRSMIIGHVTYEVMDEFSDECLYVVMTHKNLRSEKRNVLFSNDEPRLILELLEGKGYKEVLVAGGSQINALFLKKGLVDEIYLDIEPLLIGKGTPLFEEADFEIKLELLKSKKLNDNTVQLHYRVKR